MKNVRDPAFFFFLTILFLTAVFAQNKPIVTILDFPKTVTPKKKNMYSKKAFLAESCVSVQLNYCIFHLINTINLIWRSVLCRKDPIPLLHERQFIGGIL